VGSRLNASEEHFYAYLAGFLDGDGCITIKAERSKTHRLGYYIRVRVSFTQHKSRRKVLDYLCKKIGSGVVTEYVHNNMAEYVIFDQKVIGYLLDRIEPYVFVKLRNLRIAKELLSLKRGGYSKKSLVKMLSLYKKMGLLNNYPKSFKFDPVTTET
jgi:hypothetical protein